MGGPIDMSFSVFWETPMDLSKKRSFTILSRNIAKVLSIWM